MEGQKIMPVKSKRTPLYLYDFPGELKASLRGYALNQHRSLKDFVIVSLYHWVHWHKWIKSPHDYQSEYIPLNIFRFPKELYNGLTYRASQLDHKVDKLIIRILEEWVDNQVKEAKANLE